MKDEERGLQIENYGKKEQEWLDNTVTVPDSHPCTAGNKKEEHMDTATELICNHSVR